MTGSRRRRLLLIAFHYPPIQGSTGVTRSLAFSRYLPEYGWDVQVLTAHARAYRETRDENLALIPEGVVVHRAQAFNAKKHFAIFGRYPRLLTLPDQWQSWILGGYALGRRVIKEWQPDVLMSTYPIASAHRLGNLLSKKSGVPWVAELRDPMVQDGYPEDPATYRSFERVEAQIREQASAIVTTTPGCAGTYRKRFSRMAENAVRVIENGYDPSLFKKLDCAVRDKPGQPITFLHSGLLYPSERNPTEFFNAVSELKAEGHLDSSKVKFVLRASGNEESYQKTLTELNIGELIELADPMPYEQALREMIAADANMIFQAQNCDEQIPAKLYEYLYARRPIVGFANPEGDTGRLLRKLGCERVAALEDKIGIKAAIRGAIIDLEQGNTTPCLTAAEVEQFSRKERSSELSDLLNVVAERSPSV